VTAVDHLIAALVDLEDQMMEIEHRQSFVRSAIEAFGLDADDALLMAMNDRAAETVVFVDEDAAWKADAWELLMVDSQDEQPTPTPPASSKKEHNWEHIAGIISVADETHSKRAPSLMASLGVNRTTADWMVKRCREKGLIDIDRTPVNHQAARDAAAAAL
jgi:hypothetical protein